MLAERQTVDDRDRGLRRKLHHDLVRPGPDDDRVDEPVEISGHVADTLAGPENDVVRQVDRVATELVHARLERHARPETRPLEQHRQRPSQERRAGMAAVTSEFGLEALRAVEDSLDLRGAQIRNADEVAPAKRRRRFDRCVHPHTVAARHLSRKRPRSGCCEATPPVFLPVKDSAGRTPVRRRISADLARPLPASHDQPRSAHPTTPEPRNRVLPGIGGSADQHSASGRREGVPGKGGAENLSEHTRCACASARRRQRPWDVS
jgi:hypothetical protein